MGRRGGVTIQPSPISPGGGLTYRRIAIAEVLPKEGSKPQVRLPSPRVLH